MPQLISLILISVAVAHFIYFGLFESETILFFQKIESEMRIKMIRSFKISYLFFKFTWKEAKIMHFTESIWLDCI